MFSTSSNEVINSGVVLLCSIISYFEDTFAKLRKVESKTKEFIHFFLPRQSKFDDEDIKVTKKDGGKKENDGIICVN